MTKQIEFEWEEFQTLYDSWDMLFVRIDGGDWHGAQSRYGTEDQDEIIQIIKDQNENLLP